MLSMKRWYASECAGAAMRQMILRADQAVLQRRQSRDQQPEDAEEEEQQLGRAAGDAFGGQLVDRAAGELLLHADGVSALPAGVAADNDVLADRRRLILATWDR